MEIVSLKGFQDLDSLYSGLLADVKSGTPIWEDIIGKGGKLFAALRTTVQASNAFLDSIQRLADLASKTTGGSKEIGAHFTRLCMRQKRLGTKVKTMGNQLITCMVNPLSTHMDEWKKTLSQIEKDHNREAKRARGDLKRALSEANRLKRKLSKQGSSNSSSLHSRQNSGGSTIGRGVGLGEPPTSNRSIPPSVPSGIGTSSLKVRTDSAIKNLEEKVRLMEDLERASIKRLMLEERGRYCFFFNCLRPVLETETSLLGEITTLRELFTALSTATQNPSQLLDDAESVLAHTGGRVDGHSISPNGPLRSSAVNEVEAFASAVDAIMSSKQRQKREEATLSLASESFCSTSSGCSDGKNNVSGPSGSSSSPHSSQMSVHSAGSSVFALNGLNGIPAPQHQMAQILRQPRTQTDVVPRSASVGRPAVVGANQRIVSSYGADDVVLRRPANLGATAVSPRQRPLTATAPVAEPASLQLSASSTLGDPSPNQRTSTCTLQLDDATPRANTRLQTDDEAGDETASGTAEDEVSDDGLLSEDRRPSTYSTGEAWRPPNAISSEHRSLSRGGDLNKMLYPDQSLPPPVYTNLNKLTHAAQRKFSMSTATSPNADGVAWQADLESDNISIASAPHTQPDRAHTNGIYSVPESPNRPSYSTSSSISRPRGSSVGMEDPFSVEMDELDRMVTGSSATSSVTSRSGRSGTNPPAVGHSSGIPAGLLKPLQPSDTARRSRSRSSSACAAADQALSSGFERSGTTPHQDPNSCRFAEAPDPIVGGGDWPPQPISSRHHNPDLLTDVDSHASQVCSTAASLLTQLSGQLQQLNVSNQASLVKPVNQVRNEPTEFDLPAPPSPDMLDVR